jgi:hypothetical protein
VLLYPHRCALQFFKQRSEETRAVLLFRDSGSMHPSRVDMKTTQAAGRPMYTTRTISVF